MKRNFSGQSKPRRFFFILAFLSFVPCRIGPCFSHLDPSLASVWHLIVYEDLTYTYLCVMWLPVPSDWHQDFHFKHNKNSPERQRLPAQDQVMLDCPKGISLLRHVGFGPVERGEHQSWATMMGEHVTVMLGGMWWTVMGEDMAERGNVVFISPWL